MSETEAEYYDGFLVNKKPDNVYEGYMKTERELRRINQCHVRKIDELRAEIRGINGAYELLERQVSMFKNCNKSLNTMLKELNVKIDQVQGENEALKEQVKNLTEANGFLFKLLGELTVASDKVSELNKDLKQRNEKLRGILVDDLKRKVPDKIADFMV